MDILDYSGQFGQEDKVIIIKYFAFESQAHIYAARLKEEGIPCFVSNTHVGTALPLGGSANVALHVKTHDAEVAQVLLDQMDYQQRTGEGQDFREATLEDIEYEKSLGTRRDAKFWWWVVGITFITILLILRVYLRAAGVVFSDWDLF